MNCERAIEILTSPADAKFAEEREQATRHLSACADCRDAYGAFYTLRRVSLAPVPPVPAGAFERALAAARATSGDRGRLRFWTGMGVGSALAASLAIAVFTLTPLNQNSESARTPELELAIDVPQIVSISLSTDSALDDAEIHVVLSGAVDLDGYFGERSLSWRTNLAAGANQLSLPVVATGPDGGQVLVEVIHEGKRRSFLVDVKARV